MASSLPDRPSYDRGIAHRRQCDRGLCQRRWRRVRRRQSRRRSRQYRYRQHLSGLGRRVGVGRRQHVQQQPGHAAPLVYLRNVNLFSDNLVFGNSYGVQTAGGATTISDNFIHDNGGYGLYRAEQQRDHLRAIRWRTRRSASTTIPAARSIENNVISNDLYAGLQIENVSNVVVRQQHDLRTDCRRSEKPAQSEFRRRRDHHRRDIDGRATRRQHHLRRRGRRRFRLQ